MNMEIRKSDLKDVEIQVIDYGMAAQGEKESMRIAANDSLTLEILDTCNEMEEGNMSNKQACECRFARVGRGSFSNPFVGKLLSLFLIIGIVGAMLTVPVMAASYTIGNNGVYGISIDISKSPYSDAWSNGNPYGPKGCTWFAASRVEELTGINMGGIVWGPTQWYDSYWKNWESRGFSVGTALDRQHKSLICWETHIAVIEGFTSDGKIILSEGGNTEYPGNGYCTIDVYSSEAALKGKNASFKGYVYLPVAAYGSANLRGFFDELTCESSNTIHVRGWAIDDDTPNQSVDIHVYVGGSASPSVHCYPIKADKYRSDGGIGWHGFDETITVAPTGTQPVYVYAIDTAGNGFLHLSNSPRQVTIENDPGSSTVSFVGNGGMGTPERIIKKNGSTIVLPKGPVKQGYRFSNWNTSPTGSGTAYPAKSSYSKDGDVILYAQWEPVDELVLPTGLRAIGNEAFFNDTKLLSVVVPDGCTSIGESAFSWCSNLETIYIPASVTSIATDAFFNCPVLTICAPKESTAYRFASGNNVRCIAME